LLFRILLFPMDVKDYQEFVKRAEKGEILIGVEPAVARKFFTNTDHSLIKEKIGEPLFIERFFVKACWLLECVCLLAGIIVSIFLKLRGFLKSILGE